MMEHKFVAEILGTGLPTSRKFTSTIRERGRHFHPSRLGPHGGGCRRFRPTAPISRRAGAIACLASG